MGAGGPSLQRTGCCLFGFSFYGLLDHFYGHGAQELGLAFGIKLFVYQDSSKEFYGSMQYHRTNLDGLALSRLIYI